MGGREIKKRGGMFYDRIIISHSGLFYFVQNVLKKKETCRKVEEKMRHSSYGVGQITGPDAAMSWRWEFSSRKLKIIL